jgi:hypothetical protein
MSGVFWLALLILVMTVVVKDLIFAAIRRQVFYSPYHILQEVIISPLFCALCYAVSCFFSRWKKEVKIRLILFYVMIIMKIMRIHKKKVISKFLLLKSKKIIVIDF